MAHKHLGTYRGQRLRRARRQAWIRLGCNALTAIGLGFLTAGALAWAAAFGAILSTM
jgi:hypothetical protein